MIEFDRYKKFEDLDDVSKSLVGEAEKAMQSSHSPYSGFKVGAALLLENGDIIYGSNQENAAYPAGLCAERVALFQSGAVRPNVKIIALAVIAKKNGAKELNGAGPCGMCRQVMIEYEQMQKRPYTVLFKEENGDWIKTKSAGTLLPFSFGKDNL